MPKLPDDLDLKGVPYQATRPFVAVPTPDYSGVQTFARSLAAAGETVNQYALERRQAAVNTEVLNAKAGLIEAKGQFELEKNQLDPLASDYPEQVRQLWIKTVDPLVGGVQDPGAKVKIGASAREELEVESASAASTQQKAREEDQVNKVKLIGDDLVKKISEGADVEALRKELTDTVNGLEFISPPKKREVLEAMLPALDKQHVMTVSGNLFEGRDLPILVGNQPGRVSKGSVEGIQPELLGRWKRTQNIFGKPIRIVSGYRDPETNAKAKGAKKSQHLHGNAIDIDVSGLSFEERRRLIEVASANGFTGIGVYRNSIHLDLGGRRVWGPTTRAESVPGWAYEATARHMAGKVRPLGSLPRTARELWSRLEMVESGGNQSAVSPKGARGVAQIMPGTAPEAARLAGLDWDEALFYGSGPDSERYNRSLGQAYFKEMLRQFGGDPTKALAAYNAGPGRTRETIAEHGDAWLSRMPEETQNYVSKIAYGGKGVVPDIARGYDPSLRKEYVSNLQTLPSFQRLSFAEQQSLEKQFNSTLDDLSSKENKAYEQSLFDEVIRQSKVDDLRLGQKIDPKTAFDLAKGIEDPEARKAVESRIDTEVRREESLLKQAEADAKEEAYRGVVEAISSGDFAAAEQAIDQAQLPMEADKSLREMVEKGLQPKDDEALKQQLYSLYLRRNDSPEAMAAFTQATSELEKLWGKLTYSTVMDLQKKREDSMKPAASDDEVTRQVNAVTKSASGRIDDKLREIGVDPNAKTGKSDNKYANLIRSVVVQELEKFTNEKLKAGQVPLESEINDKVNEVFKAYPRAKAKTSWFGLGKGDTDVDLLEVSKEYEDAGYDIDMAVSALRGRGKAVNAQTLSQVLDAMKSLEEANN